MNPFSPWAWLAIGLSLTALLGGTYWKGHVAGAASVQAEWDQAENKRKVDEEAAVAARLRANEDLAAANEAARSKMKKGYENEITKLRAAVDASGGLRIPNTICSGFAAGAKTESANRGDGGSPGTRLVSESSQSDFAELEMTVGKVFAGCRAAQDFIKQQGMAP